MDDQKKFSLLEGLLLVMLAVINDGLEIAADFSLAIPIVGEVIAGMTELVNAVIFGVILLWFIMKLQSFGAPALLQTAGGIAEFVGIPGRTATVVIGIYLANRPRLAAVASLTSPGGAAGAAKLAGEVHAAEEASLIENAVEEGSRAEAAVGDTEEAAARIRAVQEGGEAAGGLPTAAPAAGPEGAGGEALPEGTIPGEGETAPGEARGEEGEEISEEQLGVEKEPIEKLQELLEEMPEPQRNPSAEEEEEGEEGKEGKKVPLTPR